MRKTETDYFISKKKHSKKIKYFSSLDNFFINKKDKICFLYFNASKVIEEKLTAKRVLFAYSIKDKKVILNLIPINFYPVTYNEKTDLLVGLKISDDKIKFQFYKVKK